MKRKSLAMVAVFFLFGTVSVFADFGIGLQGNFAYEANQSRPGASLLLSPKESLHFAISYNFEDHFDLGVTAEVWALTINITKLGEGDLKFFLGPGAYARMYLDNDDFGFNAGFRIPFGVDFKIQKVDAFIQTAPSFGIKFLPKLAVSDWFGWGGSIGVRFWL